eukprot:4766400-Pleurochrysis_carterae.AAC.2
MAQPQSSRTGGCPDDAGEHAPNCPLCQAFLTHVAACSGTSSGYQHIDRRVLRAVTGPSAHLTAFGMPSNGVLSSF